VGVRLPGVERDGLAQFGFRLCVLSGLDEGLTEIGVKLATVRRGGDGPAQTLDPLFGSADLREQDAGQVQGVWLVGKRREYAVIEGACLLRAPCLVVADSLAKQLAGLVHAHGRVSGGAAVLAVHPSRPGVTARQPMSRRQKPPGQSMASTAA